MVLGRSLALVVSLYFRRRHTTAPCKRNVLCLDTDEAEAEAEDVAQHQKKQYPPKATRCWTAKPHSRMLWLQKSAPVSPAIRYRFLLGLPGHARKTTKGEWLCQ